MKKILLLVIAIMMVLCSCTKQEIEQVTDEIYNFETDVQHYYNPDDFRTPVTASKDGYYYVVTGGLVIYVDKATMKGTPLCNKANCLHNDEEKCSGYLVNTDSGNIDYFEDGCFQRMIQYYKGHLYVVDGEYNSENNSFENYLYRYDLDGTNKTKITKALAESYLVDWLIHRGYFYYASDRYLSRIAMDNPEKEEVIYEIKNYAEETNSFRDLDAYGDYIYFEAMEYNKEKDIIEGDNYRMNINTLEPEKLTFNDADMSIECFVNGKIIVGDHTKPDYTRDFYITDMNFENFEFIINLRVGNSIDTDGKYLYVNNANQIDLRDVKLDEPIGQKITVYDLEMNEVDSFLLPCDTVVHSMGGQDTNCFLMAEMDYSTYDDDRSTGAYDLYYFDKSQIGSLKGDYAEIQKIIKFGWKEYRLPDGVAVVGD